VNSVSLGLTGARVERGDGPAGWSELDEPTAAVIRSLADRMTAGLRSGAFRRMVVPLREIVEDGSGTKYLSMPAVSSDYGLFVNKTATIVPAGTGGGATVTSVVSVFSTETGGLLGVLDGALVTNLKCAAVAALVTDRCAAEASRVLGIIGSGVQARQQYRAISAVRDIAEVRVHSRTHLHAAAFARYLAGTAAAGVAVRVCDSVEDASRGVDILATATTSSDPLPVSTELPEHVHINCMGAHTTRSRELAPQLLRTGVLIVEDLPTAITEAGELHRRAIDLEALDSVPVAALRGQRTIFSSTGCASLDLVTCAHLKPPAYG
jgi:ornithine cyclodeaminase/alanine dehydrogenase-like protein (mu-crystallin family)